MHALSHSPDAGGRAPKSFRPAQHKLKARNPFGLCLLWLASHASAAPWGSFERPFSADSPWNSRPIEPVLGQATIPTSDYYPMVGEGAYSTGVFLAKPGDAPLTIKGPPDKPGVWDPDAEAFRASVTIAHWPAGTVPAKGTDGHADIIDPAAGVIHSFWQLRKVGDEWRAVQYAWTPLQGRGWGEPAHYFQGSRAAGVPTSGGLIRQHEINDGEPLYRHALAMSLTFNGLAASPLYVYPATSTDGDAATANKGGIPMGSLLMLPAGFDTKSMAHPGLRKVAETLKAYGGYVVDRNYGTPFVVYVEMGSGYDLHKGADGRGTWNNDVARELHRIRAALRPVASAKSWVDGDGQPLPERPNLNLLSMRGPWIKLEGQAKGEFDTLRQALVFAPGAGAVTMASDHANKLGRLLWASPQGGSSYRLAVAGSEGASVRLRIKDCKDPAASVDTGAVLANASRTLAWPRGACGTQVMVSNGPGQAGATWVQGDLRLVSTPAAP